MTSRAPLLAQVEWALSVLQTSKSDLALLYYRAMWAIHDFLARFQASSLLN